MNRSRLVFGVLLAASVTGCLALGHSRHSPRHHAPAHGWHAKRHEVHDGALIFDAERNVYVVVGQTECYYHDRKYYRLRSGKWHTAVTLSGPWRIVVGTSIPKGLLKSKHHRAHPKKRGRGHRK